jgi:hypothetical protein
MTVYIIGYTVLCRKCGIVGLLFLRELQVKAQQQQLMVAIGGLYHQQFYLLFPYYNGWTAIGGTTPSAPTLTGSYEIEGDTHTLYLLVRGKDNNGLYLRSYDGSWNNWQLLPESANDVFGAVVQPPLPRSGAALEIVRSMNGKLYYGEYDLDSDSFLGWTWISGETLSPPTLTN